MHIIPPPKLPDDAPFSATQKMWLKGFFDGLSAIIPVQNQPPTAGKTIHILWGSQTGSAEGLAKKLAKQCLSKSHTAITRELDTVPLTELCTMQHVVIITSTYGDGEAPDNAKEFYQTLLTTEAIDLSNVHYAVYALGDSSYPDFCKCGRDIDAKLSSFGASCIIERLDCDVDYDTPFASWVEQFFSTIAA